MFFAGSDNKREKVSTIPPRLKTRSTFDPPITNSMLETFQELVTQEVTKKWDKYNITMSTPRNITYQESCAIKELEQDTSIVLKKADKGGSIVVMDATMYMNEAVKQLSDEIVYRRLTDDPTIKFKKETDEVIEEAFTMGVISADVKKTLIKEDPRVPILYLVPKIHKDPNNPSERPIVSSIDYFTAHSYIFGQLPSEHCD